MDVPADIKISSSQIFVTTSSGSAESGGVVEAFDKTNHQKLWMQNVKPGFQGASIVVDEKNSAVYAGGTIKGIGSSWTIGKFDLSTGDPIAGWPVQPVESSSSPNSDMLNLILPNSAAGGGLLALGCSSKENGDADNFVPAILGISADGKTSWSLQPNVTGGAVWMLSQWRHWV